jgi:hypothetical protein
MIGQTKWNYYSFLWAFIAAYGVATWKYILHCKLYITRPKESLDDIGGSPRKGQRPRELALIGVLTQLIAARGMILIVTEVVLSA